jgi:23S rRNA (guanosine2251-2'-O)-methyltransferase
MAGIKGSLNVSVAFGIAAYLLRYGRGVVVPVDPR